MNHEISVIFSKYFFFFKSDSASEEKKQILAYIGKKNPNCSLIYVYDISTACNTVYACP